MRRIALRTIAAAVLLPLAAPSPTLAQRAAPPLASQVPEGGPVMTVAIPAAQLVAAVAVERRSGAGKPPG